MKAATAEIDAKVENAQFQSTPPVKAATLLMHLLLAFFVISIHAAREGGDACIIRGLRVRVLFQSTPPVKAATADEAAVTVGIPISIHAAREGGDWYNLTIK